MPYPTGTDHPQNYGFMGLQSLHESTSRGIHSLGGLNFRHCSKPPFVQKKLHDSHFLEVSDLYAYYGNEGIPDLLMQTHQKVQYG